MSLSRLIGLPLDRPLLLSETLPANAPEVSGAEQALKGGLEHRADLQAAALQLKAAQQALQASRAEYLPSLSVNGSYGVQGVNPNKGANVFQASASLNVPIWSGGRTRSQIQQAEATVSQRTAELEDSKGPVETMSARPFWTFRSPPSRSRLPRAIGSLRLAPSSNHRTASPRCDHLSRSRPVSGKPGLSRA